MKKLLLVLLVVTLASFLFVGCLPTTTPAEGEGEGEGEVESACPTVSVATEVEISGVKYIKGGSSVITVTFTEATEPVSVYVGAKFDGDTSTKSNPVGVPDSALEVVVSADATKKVYTGKYSFNADVDCDSAYIYVVTCATCAPCKYPYTVDDQKPCSSIALREYPTTGCSCGGINLQFYTPSAASVCQSSYCGDDCSGLDNYTVDIYKADPFATCCDVPCLSPLTSCEGTGCDVDCTISCFDISDYTTATDKDFFAVVSLFDKVGNRQRYYAKINLDSDSINSVYKYVDQGTTSSTACPDFSGSGTVVSVNTLVWTFGTAAGASGCQ